MCTDIVFHIYVYYRYRYIILYYKVFNNISTIIKKSAMSEMQNGLGWKYQLITPQPRY